MRNLSIVCLIFFASSSLFAAQTPPAWLPADANVAVYDPGSSAAPLDRASWDAKAGWKEITVPEQTTGSVRVVANTQLVLSLRTGSAAAEAFAIGPDALWEKVFSVSPNEAGFPGKISQVRLLSLDAKKAARLVVTWSAAGTDRTLTLTVPFDHPGVGIGTEVGDGFVHVATEARHLILGDPRGYDTLISASEATEDFLTFPASRSFPYLVETVNGGRSILVGTATGDMDLRIPRVQVNGQEAWGGFESVLHAGETVWASALAAPGIWLADDATKLSWTKDLDLDWTLPYPAGWRAILTYAKGLYADNSLSFGAYIPLPDGTFLSYDARWKILKERRTWSSTRGFYMLPFLIEKGRASLRSPRFGRPDANGALRGDFVIYPYMRQVVRTFDDVRAPTRVCCVLDAVEGALGTEKMAAYDYGPAMNINPSTCSTTELIEKYVSQDEAAAHEKEIRDRAATLTAFVTLQGQRWTEYREWQEAFEAQCAEQLATHPDHSELRDSIHALLDVAKAVPALREEQKDTMGNPELMAEQARILTEAALSGDKEQAPIVETSARQIRVYGGQHDHGVSLFRCTVQKFRQQAMRQALSTRDPVVRKFLRDSIEQTEDMLKPYWGYEQNS